MRMRAFKLVEQVNARISEYGSMVVTALAMVAMAGVALQLNFGETVEAVLTNL